MGDAQKFLSNFINNGIAQTKDLGMKLRNKALDVLDLPFHKDLFLRANTGGVGGDGVLRELPDNVLGTLRTMVDKEKRSPFQDPTRSRRGEVWTYDSGDPETAMSLGRVGVYYDKQGNVLIKDNWKVDGSGQIGRSLLDPNRMNYIDLAEGGRAASDFHDVARMLGLYKEIPIEVRLTKDQWNSVPLRELP